MAQTKKQAAVTWTAVALAAISFLDSAVDRIWPPADKATKSAEGTRNLMRTMYQDMLAPKLDGMTKTLEDVKDRTFRLEGLVMMGPPDTAAGALADGEEEEYEVFQDQEAEEEAPEEVEPVRAKKPKPKLGLKPELAAPPKVLRKWNDAMPRFDQIQKQVQAE